MRGLGPIKIKSDSQFILHPLIHFSEAVEVETMMVHDVTKCRHVEDAVEG